MRRRRWLIALAVVVVLLAGATARLFVWPAQGMPARVDALVSLDTPGGTLSTALALAEQHRAPYLVISLGTPQSGYGCPRPVPGVRLICFNPDPGTTQGEAEFVGQLARKYHWRSIAIVTITPQGTRARLRVERCFSGPVHVVGTRIGLASWPYQIGYEWGALAKALVWQRSCLPLRSIRCFLCSCRLTVTSPCPCWPSEPTPTTSRSGPAAPCSAWPTAGPGCASTTWC